MGEPLFDLTALEKRAYAEDGFFLRNAAFAEHEIEDLRDAVECCAARASEAAAGGRTYQIDGNVYCEASGATIQFEHAPGTKTVRVIEPFHHLDERIDRLIDAPRLVDPIRGLLGETEVSLFTDKLNLKRPGEGSRFRWHQDSPYWAHFHPDVERLPNVMLGLDDATERNGCLRLIPASHRHGILPGLEGEGRLGPLFTNPAHFDESLQLPIALSVGSLLFFSPSVVHGSGPNDSTEPRRALIFTYQAGVRRMFKVDAKRLAGR
jgi:ectoine hydroxylase-related dioxygenase (phytanoyl-CoA dioxygenase family)